MATKKYETLHDLLILKLQALHDIESQLIKALPKMAKAAHDKKLQDAFTKHLEETKMQEERIDRALDMLHAGRGKEKSEAIRGLIKDAEWCIKNTNVGPTRDAIIIASAQYIEHYEMAGYGAARTWAHEMGHNEVADLLQESLDEEGAANKALMELARTKINDEANDMSETDEEKDEPMGKKVWHAATHAVSR